MDRIEFKKFIQKCVIEQGCASSIVLPELAKELLLHIPCIIYISDDGHGKWSIKQVEAVVKTHNPAMHFMHCVTMGDLAYLANMYYADLYPESIQTENGCIKAAILIANDPDGYEGQAFCRWVADIMAKGKSIDWEKYC